jgi:hypothetical protein
MWIVVEAAQAPQAIEKGQAHRGGFFLIGGMKWSISFQNLPCISSKTFISSPSTRDIAQEVRLPAVAHFSLTLLLDSPTTTDQ